VRSLLKAFQNLIRRFLPHRSGNGSTESSKSIVEPFQQYSDVAKLLNGKDFSPARFEALLHYHPNNWKYFFEALLHRSYLQYLDISWRSNERLEFLGDAVLNFLVAEFLYKNYPDVEEGDLTKYRSRLVNRKILAQKAKELHLTEFLLLSPSAVQSIDSGSDSILADAFEAIIGAMYLDGGVEAASNFVNRLMIESLNIETLVTADDNYKSALLEYSQAHSFGIPRYAIVREDGPDHDRRFTIEVFLGVESYGVGAGRSKKEAEQDAAFHALERINDRKQPQ
jgi:ribonuclease-3